MPPARKRSKARGKTSEDGSDTSSKRQRRPSESGDNASDGQQASVSREQMSPAFLYAAIEAIVQRCVRDALQSQQAAGVGFQPVREQGPTYPQGPMAGSSWAADMPPYPPPANFSYPYWHHHVPSPQQQQQWYPYPQGTQYAPPAAGRFSPIPATHPGRPDNWQDRRMNSLQPVYIPKISGPMRQKILQGDYIDFNELREDILRHRWAREEEEQTGVQVTCVGSLPVTSTTTDVQTISHWLDTYSVFMSHTVRAFPNRALELMEYQNIIRDAANTQPGGTAISLPWMDYDRRFRRKAAMRPELSWATKDTSVYLDACKHDGSRRLSRAVSSAGHEGHAQGKAKLPSNPRAKPPGLCEDYNTNEGCRKKKCPNQHKCIKCGQAGHPLQLCG